MESAGSNISQQLRELQTILNERMSDCQDGGSAQDIARLSALQDRKATLLECHKLIETSRQAAESNHSFKATYGNLKLAGNGFNMDGDVSGLTTRTVELKFGDAIIGPGAVSFRGRGNPDVVSTLYAGRSTAEQQSSKSNHQGQGGRGSSEQSAMRRTQLLCSVEDPLPLWDLAAETNATTGAFIPTGRSL